MVFERCFSQKLKLNFDWFDWNILVNISVLDAYFLFVIEGKPISIGFLVESDFDVTLIPLCSGLILQYICPRFAQFSSAILKRLVVSAILFMSFRFLESDLDLYSSGLFTWMVSWRRCHFICYESNSLILILLKINDLISEPLARTRCSDYSIFVWILLDDGIEIKERRQFNNCHRNTRQNYVLSTHLPDFAGFRSRQS